ncbi:hypothetical protein GGR88_001186 [Sphingomonas jejuensis]|uniref:Beta-barrel porin 2 n=1 Tax=Sphingomonas jejuensis TaxID=904715 RepID=A0ABX0XLH2_9SPHN|nr:hypothetical protein [Sphingomonas jejuensis]NJC33712.1 hypothetical protein [Sphingomonas jejuensis]
MRLLPHRAAVAVASVAALTVPTALATAQVVRSSVDLSAGAGYATNPFLISGDDTDSALVEVSVRPELRIEEESSATTIAAYARHQQYFERFDGNTDFGASADHRTQLSPRTAIRAGLVFDSSILGGSDFVTPTFTPPVAPGTTVPGTGGAVVPGSGVTPGTGVGVVPGTGTGVTPGTAPGTPIVDPVLGDIGLIGSRSRRTTFGGSLGADFTLGPRDTLNVGVSAQRSTYGNQIFGADFSQYVANAGYSRQINEGLSVGAQGIISIVDYDEAPDVTVYQPQLTFTQRLSSAWTLTGSVGVAFVDNKGGFGLPSDQSTSITGSLSACRQQVRSTLCLSGLRNTSPSGLGDVRTVTSLNASYNYQLGERDGLTLNAGYSRADGGSLAAANQLVGDQDFLSASASWSRQVAERLRVNATVGYRDIFADDFDRDADISGLIGIGYLLGDRR